MRSGLRWPSATALAVVVCLAGVSPAWAQEGTKDGMAKDSAMAHDGMGKDEMAKDGMAKDGMAKDGMEKEAMGHDAMAMAPHGAFGGIDGHKAQGAFDITTANGKSQLHLGKDFSVDKGPDVYVVLGRGEKGGPTGLSLGKLKKFSGEQTLAIPAGTDLSGYTHVVLWCKKYDATMGAAPLASADAMMHK